MKNLIEYYYNIFPDKIYVKNEVYYFFAFDIKYYFVEFNRDINELNLLVELTNKLYFKNIMVDTFVMKKDGNFYINHEGKNYVLLRVNTSENEEIDIYDVIKFNNIEVSNDNKLNVGSWVKRWENTVDTFERPVTEFNKEFPDLLSVFDYYVGLAENAISYIKNSEEENDKTFYLSHRRIKLPLTYGMIYNPISFVFDYKVRDLAEYIKELFFYSNFDEEEIMNIIDNVKKDYSQEDIKLLYGRLLFPTYYFDLFEKVLNKEKEEKELKRIINLSESYECFLKELYLSLKVTNNIEAIDWICK